MELLIALSATRATFGIIAIFGILFPAIVGGLVTYSLAQAARERQENLDELDNVER